jgi:hypothetical protein
MSADTTAGWHQPGIAGLKHHGLPFDYQFGLSAKDIADRFMSRFVAGFFCGFSFCHSHSETRLPETR